MSMHDEKASKLLSPEEAASRLKVTPHTLAVWRTTKRYPLPYTKIGRLVRYRADDVEAFVTRNLRQAA